MCILVRYEMFLRLNINDLNVWCPRKVNRSRHETKTCSRVFRRLKKNKKKIKSPFPPKNRKYSTPQ